MCPLSTGHFVHDFIAMHLSLRYTSFMNYQDRYFVKKLNEVFELRKSRNNSYSVRAFARDLDLPRSTIFEVLKGRRLVPTKKIKHLLETLPLSPIEKTLFSESLYRTKVKLDEIEISEDSVTQRHLIDDSHYKIIAEWEHYAVLSLLDTNDFESSETFIASRINISKERVKVVLENLEMAGFIKTEKNQYIKTTEPLATTEDIPSETLRNAHKEVLELSQDKLDECAVEDRDYSTVTIAINSEKISEAKSIIREFRKKMMVLLSDGQRDEVYQIAIQMYPLTNLKQRKLQ